MANSEINKNELSDVVEKMTNGSLKTTKAVTDLSEQTDQLKVLSEKQNQLSAKALSDANFVSDQMSKNTSNASLAESQIFDVMEKITKAFAEVKNFIPLLNEINAQTIFISEVASQSKMLALNARIEASQAKGESAKSFSIIANEMQSLANKSTDTVYNVEKTIQSATKKIEESIFSNEKQVEDGNKMAKSTAQILKDMSSVSNEDNNKPSVNDIIEFITEIDQATEKLNNVVNNIEDSKSRLSSEVDISNQVISDMVGVVEGNRIENMDVNTVSKILPEFIIIDVRRSDEYNGQGGHIQGSKHLQIDENFAKKIQTFDREKRYLFVCQAGGRSSRASRIAQGMKFQNVINMTGGMNAWVSSGLEVIKS